MQYLRVSELSAFTQLKILKYDFHICNISIVIVIQQFFNSIIH